MKKSKFIEIFDNRDSVSVHQEEEGEVYYAENYKLQREGNIKDLVCVGIWRIKKLNYEKKN